MSPEEIKAVMRKDSVFCVNCAHYLRSKVVDGVGTVADVCGRGHEWVDLVRGTKSMRFSTCADERGSTTGGSFQGPCGPWGIHYKART